MLIITYQCIVNKAHYIEHQTRGKGCDTYSLNLRPSCYCKMQSKYPRSLFEGGLNLKEATIQGVIVLCVGESKVPPILYSL